MATGAWRARFGRVADDLRAALAWAADQPEHRAAAYRLALSIAELAFTRNLVGESQLRYEQAATLADQLGDTAQAYRRAAAVAGCRMLGDDMYRLHRAAAAAAFDKAGCRYQWARTLLLAGGEHASTGAAAFAGLGITAADPARPTP